MDNVLSVIGLAFTAVCIWLGVRIINRRERWMKWMLAAAIGLSVLYVASFGPALRLLSKERGPSVAWVAYRPMTLLMFYGPKPTQRCLRGYAAYCASDEFLITLGLEEMGLVYILD